MPDRRTHRGPHPEDHRLFAADVWPILCQATADLCWLLGRGYAEPSSLKLVGDRYNLLARQRLAVARAACPQASLARRKAAEVAAEAVKDVDLWLDGYNVLTTIEAALSGGVLLLCCDGTLRDMASMHGSYRKVAETVPAIEMIGQFVAQLQPRQCRWYLDSPVSNSGRLKNLIEAIGRKHGWHWEVCLVADPDPMLIGAQQRSSTAPGGASRQGELPLSPSSLLPLTPVEPPVGEIWAGGQVCRGDRPSEQNRIVVATADSAILDACGPWFNLARHIVARYVPHATIVDLSGW